MKFKKLALVLVVVLMASTLAPVFAKSPFADVPADHWAYDSIVELAAAGLIEGYPDGTYGGSRMMTRYEAAMVFARALTRLENQIADTNVLPELDKIKAELMAEIKAQMAAMDKPVVETKVVEKVGVVDEETLARVRAAEIAAEGLEGDIAYVEARVLGLIDGIRYDVNKLQEQVDAPAVEQPSMEEIEALIAAKVQEGILEAALSAKEVVKETTVVEKVVSTTPELTEEDVELIAQAMIAQQLQQYELLIVRALRENAEQTERIEALEAAQAELATKEELAEVKTAVKALEKIKLGGTLELKADSYDEDEDQHRYEYAQTANLNLNIKVSDTVNVKAIASGSIKPNEAAPFSMSTYGVDVTSEGLAKRLLVGKRVVTGPEVNSRFGSYVLAPLGGSYRYQFAGLADLDVVEGLTGNILLASPKAGVEEDIIVGLGLKYKLSPAFGVKTAVTGLKPFDKAVPTAKALGAGIFGEIAKVKYDGEFSYDRNATADNMLFGGSLSTKLGPVSLSGKYVQAQDNYGATGSLVKRPFVEDSANLLELGAGVEFLGIDLDGTFYREAKEATETAKAYKLGASAGFDLVVPVRVAATYAVNDKAAEEDKNASEIKLAVGPEKAPELGFNYGASFTMIKNKIKDDKWKVAGNYTGEAENIVAANLGYKFDLRGAVIGLGYGATYTMPVESAKEKTLKHKVDLGYDFTKDVKLTLGSVITQTLSEPIDNLVSYNAGLSVKF